MSFEVMRTYWNRTELITEDLARIFSEEALPMVKPLLLWWRPRKKNEKVSQV